MTVIRHHILCLAAAIVPFLAISEVAAAQTASTSSGQAYPEPAAADRRAVHAWQPS